MELACITLGRNDILPATFATAIVDLLIHGRSKGRNILLLGRGNCGKSFLLRPLEVVFRALSNPAGNSFAFGDILEKDIILLDDFRYTAKGIRWADLLLLLDGATVHFSLPRTHYAKDVELPPSNTIPVFATGKSLPAPRNSDGSVDEIEAEMMRWRFKIFVLSRTIAENEVVECSPCAKCFCDFLDRNAEQLAEQVFTQVAE